MYLKKYEDQQLNEIAFPLGGIGAGCISLAGNGELVDWEIFNKPNKGFQPRYAFFAIRMKQAEGEPVFRVLQGQLHPPFQGRNDRWGWGPARERGAGLPRFKDCNFTATWPVSEVNFIDKAVPLDVKLQSWSPFWPNAAYEASLPAAIFYVHLHNPTARSIDASVMFNMCNPAGWPGESNDLPRWHNESGYRGLSFDCKEFGRNDSKHTTLAVATDWKDCSYQVDHFFENHDYPGYFDLLERFINEGRLKNRTNSGRGDDRLFASGAIAMHVKLQPGEKKLMPLILTWHRPWVEKTWISNRGENPNFSLKAAKAEKRWQNWYSTKFKNALDVAKLIVRKHAGYFEKTVSYIDALAESTMSLDVLDAASSQVSTLKSPTVHRLTDGTLWGWEGCGPDSGVCFGSANHVWGFAQAAPYLMAELDRTMLESFFMRSTFDARTGQMTARVDLPLGSDSLWVQPASDGQFCMILRMYRYWRLTGDKEWLEKYSAKIFRALEYAWTRWDKDLDGLMEQPHDHTYDGVFTSAEPQSQVLYLAALRACEEVAKFLGKDGKAETYNKRFCNGSRLTDELLFNGEYYRQHISKGQSLRGQLGNGCLIDQLQGQWHATNLGLGYLLKPSNVKRAVKSIFKYNFMSNGYEEWVNRYRAFALNDERGTVICTWPHGDRPAEPFLYADETMIGFEYQLACLLIQQGFVKEGEQVVKAVRDRFDGHKRNPWNEFECGSHYARSMASFGLIIAESGFDYSAVEKHIGFSPAGRRKKYTTIFSVPEAWGVYRESEKNAELEIIEGELNLKTFKAGKLGTFDINMKLKSGERLEVANV